MSCELEVEPISIRDDTSQSAIPEALTGISVVLPAYNEAPVIARAVREAARALATLPIPSEIIVVDDGSTDATAATAAREAREHAAVRIVSLAQNAGYAAALKCGFLAARYELVAFSDADCQFDLHDLKEMTALARDADVVCGYRIARQDSTLRRFYSWCFNCLARGLLRTGVRD